MRRRAAWALLAFAASAVPAGALPTMVRLGYPNCVSCHHSPQGGGLLNEYGRGIDEAQSLRADEYKRTENAIIRSLSWGNRITQDLRMVSQEAASGGTDLPLTARLRSRFMYRNVTEFSKALRVSATVYGENESTPRPAKAYEHPVRPGTAFLATAMVHYRPNQNMEFAAGRDLLPAGVLTSDLTPFVRSRNRQGYYDTPTQVKAFFWGQRYQVSPFAFAPSGEERAGEGERGGGALAEFDVFGKQRTVVGVTVLRANARNGDRHLEGLYARLGFGKWGILAEHDITHRSVTVPTVAAFRQNASFAQVFWAAREWFVISLIGERLRVQAPFQEKLDAGKVEVSARLTSQISLVLNTRLQHNPVTGQWAPSAGLQLAVKTPN